MTAPRTTAERRQQANQTVAELRRLIQARLKGNGEQPINWHALGYCYWRAARLHPGKHRLTRAKGGKLYQGSYWCLPPTDIAADALRKIVRFPPDWIVEAFAAGMAKANRSKRMTFMSADAIAKMLGVTIAERDALDLRRIGDIDLKKAGRAKRRKEKDRVAAKARMQRRRRASGARPQAESANRLKPWKAAGRSRTSFYALSERQRAEIMAAMAEGYTISADWTVSFGNIFPKGINITANESVQPGVPSAAGAADDAVLRRQGPSFIDKPPEGGAPASLVGDTPTDIPVSVQLQESPMSQSVPVATLERDIREGGHSTATLRAQDVLREFGVFCSMSKGAVLDALMSRENRAYEVYNAIGIEPPDEVIFARNERWSTVGLAA